jgi:hypothetical protein
MGFSAAEPQSQATPGVLRQPVLKLGRVDRWLYNQYQPGNLNTHCPVRMPRLGRTERETVPESAASRFLSPRPGVLPMKFPGAPGKTRPPPAANCK